jgi:hypothetical protein
MQQVQVASGNGIGMVLANDRGDTPALQTRARMSLRRDDNEIPQLRPTNHTRPHRTFAARKPAAARIHDHY